MVSAAPRYGAIANVWAAMAASITVPVLEMVQGAVNQARAGQPVETLPEEWRLSYAMELVEISQDDSRNPITDFRNLRDAPVDTIAAFLHNAVEIYAPDEAGDPQQQEDNVHDGESESISAEGTIME